MQLKNVLILSFIDSPWARLERVPRESQQKQPTWEPGFRKRLIKNLVPGTGRRLYLGCARHSVYSRQRGLAQRAISKDHEGTSWQYVTVAACISVSPSLSALLLVLYEAAIGAVPSNSRANWPGYPWIWGRRPMASSWSASSAEQRGRH